MNNEQRKNEIRRKLQAGQFSKRSDALFTDESDHNPLVLDNCLRCRGTGKIDIHQKQGDEETWSLEVCSHCSGTGTSDSTSPYFDNHNPAIDVKVGEGGWLKCPCCGWTFTIRDVNVWTGRRHKRCGQKLNLIST